MTHLWFIMIIAVKMFLKYENKLFCFLSAFEGNLKHNNLWQMTIKLFLWQLE